MNAPLVSVICTGFNQGRFIKEALDSVLHQSYAPIQLIIIDNNSSDNSLEHVQEWIKRKNFPDV